MDCENDPLREEPGDNASAKGHCVELLCVNDVDELPVAEHGKRCAESERRIPQAWRQRTGDRFDHDGILPRRSEPSLHRADEGGHPRRGTRRVRRQEENPHDRPMKGNVDNCWRTYLAHPASRGHG